MVGVSLDSMSSLLSWVRLHHHLHHGHLQHYILRTPMFSSIMTITTILKVRGSATLSSFPLPLIADRSADLAKRFGVLQPAQRY